MNKVRYLGLVMALAILMTLIGASAAQDDIKVLRTDIGPSDVPTLDPAIATDSSSIQMLDMTYIGLTNIAEDSSTQPGMATEWTVEENEDGTATYTFTLLQNVPWVRYNAESDAVEELTDDAGNVRYVNAHDFVYGWLRTLDPQPLVTMPMCWPRRFSVVWNSITAKARQKMLASPRLMTTRWK